MSRGRLTGRIFRRRAARFGVLALAVLLAAAGCRKRETAAEVGVRTQTLLVALKAEPRDLDPHTATAPDEFTVTMALMEGLTTLDPANSAPLPGAAERWEVTPDGKQWTFHLRANGRWSNGDPVTAADFVRGCQRILTPTLGAEYAPQLYCLEGAEDFHRSRSPTFAGVGVKAPDERTVLLTLNHPVPYLAALTALPAWFPIHRATMEKFDAMGRRGTGWTRPGNHVGNGPFVLETWRPNESIRVRRADTYWDAGNVRLAAAVFFPVENLITQEAMFRAGQLHVTADNLPAEKVRAYREDPARRPLLHQGALLATKFFRFNCNRAPLGDPRVRRALALAIDRPTLTRQVMQTDLAAVSFTPPDCAGYTAEPGVTTNLAEARSLLAAAGFPEGRGFPKLNVLFYPSGSSGLPVAEAVQQMWRAGLGIDVGVVQQETKTVLDARRSMNYDILLSDWFGDYIDPSTFLDLWISTSEHNKTGWSSAEYDGLLREAANTPEPAARFALMRRAEAILLAAVPITPLFHQPTNELRHPAVHGWHSNLLATHPLQFVWLEAVRQ
jgi:oligopeptide transport system substrate-binding protein